MGTMKDYLAKRKATATEKPAPSQESSSPKKQKQPRVEADSNSVVVYRCGHGEAVAFLRSIPCPACRNQARRERNAKRQQNGEKREQNQNAQRLPDESSFNVVYDAEKREWSGYLSVYVNDEVKILHATASGVFKLLMQLDAEYRKVAAEAEGRPCPVD